MAKSSRRKRVNLRVGDVFEIPLPDGRFGYGIVAKQGALPGGGTPYIAIFRSAYNQPPSVAEIMTDEVALQGWTTDALIYHERWKVIEFDAAVPAIQFPNFKVGSQGKFYVTDVDGEFIDLATPRELGLLNYRFSSTAGIFQEAFEAIHGFGEWKDHFDELTPAYVRSHVTRSIRLTS
ncbi:MAG: Imm26 family immunity protein [Allosphingosinicella sp.]|uniref:Imm26 family immunity protein n=1 Tax=Allosphingosinicella sp. TaxID=2823234 RepID=UPI00392066D5